MAATGSFIVAQNSKLVVHAGKSTQMTVRGLQSLQIPIGATAGTTTISEMGRRIDVVVATGLTYEEITCNYNFRMDDPSQTYLMDCSRNATQIQDARFYIDECDFAALDLINDSGGYMMVGTFSSPQAAKNEVFTGSVSFLPAGSFILFSNHVGGTAISTTAQGGTGAEIADSSSRFVTNGFEAGMVLLIDYLDGEDPFYMEAASVNAGTIVCTVDVGDYASFPTASGSASTMVHGATPIEISDYASVDCGA